uniref:Mitochondrial glycine transporter n=1 Tax=Steinernema glaseri TaxID=37863 RepID=A0A1I7ZKF8_9BILA
MGSSAGGSVAKNAVQRSSTSRIVDAVIFGSASAALSAIILQPLDRLKTIVQQDAKSCSLRRSLYDLTSKHGVADLWRGLSPSLVRIIPGVAVYFGCMEGGKKWFHVEKSNTAYFGLGFFSRAAATIVLLPATVVKTRFESSVYRDKNLIDSVRNVVSTYGIRGLWRGTLPTIFRDAPFSGIYLMLYRMHLSVADDFLQVGPFVRFASGVSSGIVACVVTHPFDVVKTHVQLYPAKYRGSYQATVMLWQELGLHGFLKGFALRATRRTLMSALNWTLFDEFLARYRPS